MGTFLTKSELVYAEKNILYIRLRKRLEKKMYSYFYTFSCGATFADLELEDNFPLSLSTIVLNSRDWSEIIWLPRNSHFKINLPIGLYPKKPAGMHWLGHNNAVP